MPLRIELVIKMINPDSVGVEASFSRGEDEPTREELEIANVYRMMIEAAGRLIDLTNGDEGIERARRMNEAAEMMSSLISKVKH